MSDCSGDAWLRILHLNDDPKVLAFRLDAGHGCAAESLAALSALCGRAFGALEELLLAASEAPGAPRRLVRAAAQLAPSTVQVLRRVVALKALEVKLEPLRDRKGRVNVLRVDVKVPLDFEELQKHYQRPEAQEGDRGLSRAFRRQLSSLDVLEESSFLFIFIHFHLTPMTNRFEFTADLPTMATDVHFSCASGP